MVEISEAHLQVQEIEELARALAKVSRLVDWPGDPGLTWHVGSIIEDMRKELRRLRESWPATPPTTQRKPGPLSWNIYYYGGGRWYRAMAGRFCEYIIKPEEAVRGSKVKTYTIEFRDGDKSRIIDRYVVTADAAKAFAQADHDKALQAIAKPVAA